MPCKIHNPSYSGPCGDCQEIDWSNRCAVMSEYKKIAEEIKEYEGFGISQDQYWNPYFKRPSLEELRKNTELAL